MESDRAEGGGFQPFIESFSTCILFCLSARSTREFALVSNSCFHSPVLTSPSQGASVHFNHRSCDQCMCCWWSWDVSMRCSWVCSCLVALCAIVLASAGGCVLRNRYVSVMG